MKVFLDDFRHAPAGWEVARDYNDMIRILSQNKGKVTDISLDYDLDSIRNGYNVCEWLVNNNYWPESIIIHSSHATGPKKMKELLEKNAPNTTKIELSPRL